VYETMRGSVFGREFLSAEGVGADEGLMGRSTGEGNDWRRESKRDGVRHG
jgi:hypothetical protein